MGQMKKKFQSGAATQYISRKKACKRLQLSLADFRRLCIFKGIYPRQPENKKKVNKGSTSNKTFYFLKDIQYMMHEPIINKFREYKIFARKLRKAEARDDKTRAAAIREGRPTHTLDHIVLERYPSLDAAIGDLDDALNLNFLFARLPKSGRIYVETIELCRRLTVEFMHYVMMTRSLSKVFISIKGYYYQADIMGHKVTWIVAHPNPHAHPTDVDFKVMSSFTEISSTMLGFALYGLYQKANLFYPPKLNLKTITNQASNNDDEEFYCDKEEMASETVNSLNAALTRACPVEDDDNDELDEELEILKKENPDASEKDYVEKQAEAKAFKKLFEGKKVFISREVPREPFVFMIRSFGGEVSWPKTVGIGSTFDESDPTITHHLVDRPNPKMDHGDGHRKYVQPQWVADCVNARVLISERDYMPGMKLPAHCSPFADESEGMHIPLERQRIIDMQKGNLNLGDDEEKDLSESEEEEDSDEEDVDEEEVEKAEEDEKETEKQTSSGSSKKDVVIQEAPKDTHKNSRADKVSAEDLRLAKKQMSKKTKKLYGRIMYSERRKARQAEELKNKRKAIDEAAKQDKKKRKKN